MATLLSYLPPFDGLLPKWLFLVSVISAANSLQSYRSPAYVSSLYSGPGQANKPRAQGQRKEEDAGPTNPLSGRTFGTWTFLSAVVRLYAAYHLTTPVAYDLAIWTFGIALVHFSAEWLVFGSAQLKGRFVSPMIVASVSLAWMLTARQHYLQSAM